jgi:hypothetical protein
LDDPILGIWLQEGASDTDEKGIFPEHVVKAVKMGRDAHVGAHVVSQQDGRFKLREAEAYGPMSYGFLTVAKDPNAHLDERFFFRRLSQLTIVDSKIGCQPIV